MEPIFEREGHVTDTFMNTNNLVTRLIHEYQEHNNIIVAYDFDDTVCPSKPTYDCSYVIELLQELSKLDTITLICFTCRNGESDILEIKEFADSHNFRCDCINDNSPTLTMDTSRKIFYNIFLEERGGLKTAYEILVRFLDWYYHERKEE
ncbi:MAG: hypothetical protein NC548_27845 [Lachnospiraceae bacterium]|nr:hypothetical protein [Lachnospiraceae bacterium]